jgi:hypothetical protein
MSKLSEAQQRAREQDVGIYVELTEQQRREQRAQTITSKQVAKQTEAGQDPENRNLYDNLKELQKFLKGDTRIKTSQATQKAREQENQIKQVEQERAKVNANRDQYTPESVQAYNEAVDNYLIEARSNVEVLQEAAAQGRENIGIYTENIKILNATSVNPPTPRRTPTRTSPPINILETGPPGESRLPTNRGNQFIDALGETEQQIGQQAIDYIDSVNPPTREPSLRKRGAEQFEAYEETFNITTELREAGFNLGVEAREPLEEGKAADLLKVVAGAGLTFTAGAADALTAPIRPGFWAKNLQSANQLATDPEARSKAVQAFTMDPTGALFYGVGQFAGTQILSVANLEVKDALNKQRSLKARETASKLWDKYGDESAFTQFESEIVLDYPDEVMSTIPDTVGIRKVKVTDETGSYRIGYEYFDLITEEKPVISPVKQSKTVTGLQYYDPDDPFNVPDFMAPGGSGGGIKVVSTDSPMGYMKPLNYADDAIPVSSGKQVLEASVITPTKQVSKIKPVGLSVDVEYGYGRVVISDPFELKAVNLKDVGYYQGTTPNVKLGDFTRFGVIAIPSVDTKTPVKQKDTLDTKILQPTSPRSTVNIKPVPGSLPDISLTPINIPDITPTQSQKTTPRQRTPLIQLPDVIQPVEPRIKTPTPPEIFDFPEPKPPTPDIETQKKKTKKKRGKKTLGAFELRVDKAFNVDFKEPKIKEFKI